MIWFVEVVASEDNLYLLAHIDFLQKLNTNHEVGCPGDGITCSCQMIILNLLRLLFLSKWSLSVHLTCSSAACND